MGRLGPLTSQALGRSPYDAVVPGEGEADPREPPLTYDERGRPVNPETKRINRDVVRSHNEVMLVIGVAEPDNGTIPDAQAEMRERQNRNEDKIGVRLLDTSHLLLGSCVWGLNGLRQHILLYRRYAHIPFLQLFPYDRSQRSAGNFFLGGLPSFIFSDIINRFIADHEVLQNNTWAIAASRYINIHLDLFALMQQMGLISVWPSLPPPAFFIPFTASSPIQAPPALESMSFEGVTKWLGITALQAAPVLAYLSLRWLQISVARTLARQISRLLPMPINRTRFIPPPPPPVPPTPQPPVEASTSNATPAGTQTTADSQTTEQRAIPQDETTMRALEGRRPAADPAPPAARRQSMISSRGDDYVSDEEDAELVSGTLISFDVEATESTDTPPGVWSAELRPNIVGDPRSLSRDTPEYAENFLTRLPSFLAAELLGIAASYVVVAPYEAFALRLWARGFRYRNGSPMGDIYEPNILSSVSRTAIGNYLGVLMVEILVGSEGWALVTGLAELYRGTDADWSFFRVLREKLWDGKDA